MMYRWIINPRVSKKEHDYYNINPLSVDPKKTVLAVIALFIEP